MYTGLNSSIMKKIVMEILPATSIIVISMYLNSILIFQQKYWYCYQKGSVFHKGFQPRICYHLLLITLNL